MSVAFVWHMHQPFYKDLVSHEYILPWVRLHAIKDYYDMAAYLDKYPKIRAVFNVVPSLLAQVEDYTAGTANDKFLELTKKAPEDLSQEEKVFILKNFFLSNWETMIRPYPRYNDLLLKRGRFVSLDDIVNVSRRFSSQEFQDLQVWFNLSWFGALYKQNDHVIKGLIEKGKNFSEQDKKDMISKQLEVMKLVIPKYKEMQERGQIELSVTPFYHPILPLLCDNEIARVSSPGIILPKHNFAYPEDAEYQIKKAVEFYREKFGADPAGMWPSEGSVSEAIVPMAARAGIKWIATDEEILSNSLERRLSAADLFKPYIFEKDGEKINIVFRDHRISDDVGFIYSRWNPHEAAADIVGKLHKIKDVLPDDNKRYLVSIILDGENAWEYYSNNGKDFFDSLYKMLSNDHGLDTVRVRDFIEQNPGQERMSRLFPGSWINHNFNVWIGHAEDNTAWDYLYRTREALASAEDPPKEAWEELYIAEGSDWNWWYGDDHSSANDEEFDQLFRQHLINIYRLIGQEYPKYLDAPIKKMKLVKPTREPVYLIKPMLDGEVTNYYEWLSAGLYSIEQARGAMHQSETIVKNIYYGFSQDTLYVRVDTTIDLSCSEEGEMRGVSFEFQILKPSGFKAELSCSEGHKKDLQLYRTGPGSDTHEKVKDLDTFGVCNVIEVGIPFSDIGIKGGDEVHLCVSVKKDGKELENWPKGGVIMFNAPDEDYIASSWFV